MGRSHLGLMGKVSRLNPNGTSTGAAIEVGVAPKAVAFDGRSVWVANSVSSTVTKVRP